MKSPGRDQHATKSGHVARDTHHRLYVALLDSAIVILAIDGDSVLPVRIDRMVLAAQATNLLVVLDLHVGEARELSGQWGPHDPVDEPFVVG